jgi:hypothetical protein
MEIPAEIVVQVLAVREAHRVVVGVALQLAIVQAEQEFHPL